VLSSTCSHNPAAVGSAARTGEPMAPTRTRAPMMIDFRKDALITTLPITTPTILCLRSFWPDPPHLAWSMAWPETVVISRNFDARESRTCVLIQSPWHRSYAVVPARGTPRRSRRGDPVAGAHNHRLLNMGAQHKRVYARP